MRRRTLQAELDDALDRCRHRIAEAEIAFGKPTVEIVHAVALTDYPTTTEAFERQRILIDTQQAEIGQLRMLLRQARAGLDLMRSSSDDYRRLMKNIDRTLEHTTLESGGGDT